MDKDKKPFHKGNRKPFRKDRRGASGGRFKRKLEPGVEFDDRRLGVGIVRKVTEDGIGPWGCGKGDSQKEKDHGSERKEAGGSGKTFGKEGLYL